VCKVRRVGISEEGRKEGRKEGESGRPPLKDEEKDNGSEAEGDERLVPLEIGGKPN